MGWGRNRDQQDYDIIPGMVVDEPVAEQVDVAVEHLATPGEPYYDYSPELHTMAWFTSDGTLVRPFSEEEENRLMLGLSSGVSPHAPQQILGQTAHGTTTSVHGQNPAFSMTYTETKTVSYDPSIPPELAAAYFLLKAGMPPVQGHQSESSQATGAPSATTQQREAPAEGNGQERQVGNGHLSEQSNNAQHEKRLKFRPIRLGINVGAAALGATLGFGFVSWFPLTFGPQHSVWKEISDLPSDYMAVLNHVSGQPVEKKN